jgi:fumarylacetoacetate (FAA) hydrolase
VAAPVAVTPDELGAAWLGGRAELTLQLLLNGRPLGRLETGGMQFHFGQLLAQAARQRPLQAGSLLVAQGLAAEEPGHGVGCVAEKRALEPSDLGAPRTPWLQPGDTLHAEIKGRDGHGLFGAIDQAVGDLS